MLSTLLQALLGVLLLSAPLHAEVYCLQLEQRSHLLLPAGESTFIPLPHLGLGILRSEEDPQTLAALPGVRSMATSNRNHLFFTPSEPYYPNQQPYLQMISAEEAWDITRGDQSFVVAVIDTGIDDTHEDLRDKGFLKRAKISRHEISVAKQQAREFLVKQGKWVYSAPRKWDHLVS